MQSTQALGKQRPNPSLERMPAKSSGHRSALIVRTAWHCLNVRRSRITSFGLCQEEESHEITSQSQDR